MLNARRARPARKGERGAAGGQRRIITYTNDEQSRFRTLENPLTRGRRRYRRRHRHRHCRCHRRRTDESCRNNRLDNYDQKYAIFDAQLVFKDNFLTARPGKLQVSRIINGSGFEIEAGNFCVAE